MPSERVHLHIEDVILAVPASAGVEAGMVILTEDDPPFRSLRIIIGQPEAKAIQAAWHGAVPGRPATWDLFISAVAILGGRLDSAVITAVQEERHYFAVLELEQNGERRILACRPSDAIALAVRGYNAGIFAESSVLADAGFLPDGRKASEVAAAQALDAKLESESDSGNESHGDTGTGTEAALAAREAALTAREAELEAREQALARREPPQAGAGAAGTVGPVSPADRSVIAADALEVAAEAVAVAAEALERPSRPPADPPVT